MDLPQSSTLSTKLTLLMAVAVGLSVASNNYAQPLLHSITEDLHISTKHSGIIVMTSQFCYALGLLFIAPLGDKIERKKLITMLMLLTACGLMISAVSQSQLMLIIGTAIAGMFSTVAQVLIPFSATLAAPHQRGKVVGILMSGMLLGILIGRTFAGAISTYMDWHMVYGVAGILMCIMALVLHFTLPRYRNKNTLYYWPLIISVFSLFRQEKVLRIRALIGGLTFGIFSLLWTPLAFLLSDAPYHYSDFVIGLFGLAGAAGAMGAPIVGRLSDKGKGNLVTSLGLSLILLAWLPLACAQMSLLALIVGIVLLDLSVQVTQVTSLNAIYQSNPDMRTRMNVGYMFCYFTGGMLGAFCSTYLFAHNGWQTVSIAAIGLAIMAILVWVYDLKTR